MQKAIIELTVADDGELTFSVKAEKDNMDAMAIAVCVINAYTQSEGIDDDDVEKRAEFFGEDGQLIGTSDV